MLTNCYFDLPMIDLHLGVSESLKYSEGTRGHPKVPAFSWYHSVGIGKISTAENAFIWVVYELSSLSAKDTLS